MNAATFMPSPATLVALREARVTRPDYAVQFNTAADQDVVRGALEGRYAIPVTGLPGRQPTFLTGSFGSARTPSAAASGGCLSTGAQARPSSSPFLAAQSSFALLWGSINSGDLITFGNGANDVLTGADIQAIASGFAGAGFQGPRGSAYAAVTSNTPFNTVTLGSTVVAFEAAALVGSDAQRARASEPCTAGQGLSGPWPGPPPQHRAAVS